MKIMAARASRVCSALVAISVGVLSMSAQAQVTATSNNIPGVQIVAPTAAEFSEEAKRLIRGGTADVFELLRYGMIVRNVRSLPMTGIDILYELTVGGEFIVKNFLYSSPNMAAPDFPVIPVGESRLFVPSHAANNASVTRQPLIEALGRPEVGRALMFLARAERVAISVDSVVRSDGKLYGPDKAGTLEKFRRGILGYREFREALLARLTSGESDTELMVWLAKEAQAPLMKRGKNIPIDRGAAIRKQTAEQYIRDLRRGERSEALKRLQEATPERKMRQVIKVHRAEE